MKNSLFYTLECYFFNLDIAFTKSNCHIAFKNFRDDKCIKCGPQTKLRISIFKVSLEKKLQGLLLLLFEIVKYHFRIQFMPNKTITMGERQHRESPHRIHV